MNEADLAVAVRRVTDLYIKKSLRPDVAPGYEYRVVLPDGSTRWAATLEAARAVQDGAIRDATKAELDRAAREAEGGR